jgi:chromosome segregation ATPase
MMREQLEQRLKELKVEFESGQRMMADLEAQQANLNNTLLRISGAIQVIEELLAKETQSPSNAIEPGDANSVEEAGTG